MKRFHGIVALGAVLMACGGSDSGGPSVPSRSYRMGFSAIPPRVDTTLLIPTLTLAAQHSDIGLVQLEIPWATLLADTSAAEDVRLNRLPLVNFYRETGRPVVVALDVTDGLNRSAEAPPLVAAGRSIADTAIQRLYREYVAAVDTILEPEYISLAAETNLIRLQAAPAVYQAMVTMTNAAAAERAAHGSGTTLLVSVQVDVAWGQLPLTGVYQGIATDRTDFPFIQALGLSSYPYLAGYSNPDQIPLDYYERLTRGSPLPVLVLEGGWASGSTAEFASSPALQAAYIARHARILDSADARVWLQITFTDLDIANIPLPPGSILPLFASNGLVTIDLTPKPALGVWDSVFTRRLAN